MRRKKGFFSISAVAQMFSVHQQTIRLYEKEGLITPKRSDGNTRLFSEEDINQLEQIIYLTHQLGINLAGVEMVLKLQDKVKKLQKQMNKILDATHEELEQESGISKRLATTTAKQLMEMKQVAIKKPKKADEPVSEPIDIEIDTEGWKIEYDQ
ncbi:MAG: MerR family transcriptional regulator [Candidatus Babeliales bacterium]